MWHNVQVRKSFQGRWKYAETCTNPILHKRHRKRGFLKKVGEEGENAANQHFLLFPLCFLSFPKQISLCLSHLFCCLRMLSFWTSPKFCCLVNSLENNKILDTSKLKAINFAKDDLCLR